MKKTLTNVLLAATMSVLVFATVSCSNKVVRTVNPVIYGDVPDPDILRVGDDYYMTSTTMHLLPGVPIMHSTDLVNWEIINYVYDQLEDNDKANLENGAHSYGGGSWASSIKYYDGMFHICFIANEQGKSYIYHTKDLTGKDWTRSDFNVVFHDPALFKDDDGRHWVVYGNGVLKITELTDGFKAVKQDSIVDSVLLNLRSRDIQLNAEGSHLYKRNGYYYLFDIDWPRGGVRREIVNRSQNILGPYEQKTVLYTSLDEGKGGFSANGVAQGGIVDTPTGEWYALLFQDHGGVGRCPVLVPMEWENDWPVLAGGDAAGAATGKTYGAAQLPQVGQMPAEVSVQTKKVSTTQWYTNDEFNYKENILNLAWQWNHNPDNSAWSVTERPGWLRLKSASVVPHIFRARNSLSQRTVGPRCETEVLMDFSGLKAGDRAGLCAFQSNYTSVGIAVAEDGSKSLQVLQRTGRGNDKRTFGTDEDGAEVKLNLPVPAGISSVALKVIYTFDPVDLSQTKRDFVNLAYSFDGGKNWQDCGIELQMRYTLDVFMGYRTFLYCFSTIAKGGHADFEYYHVTVK
ncbi:MAG: glycosyl hydrolase 43 family protein [Bacteroidales bacterium]|nr:glycosyl hydrolase 43 family protein [Bacteroidales bacterium]